MYAIVSFCNDGTYDIVPQQWLRGEDKCLWPPAHVRAYDVSTLIRHKATPKHDWIIHDITILSIAETYSEARKKARKAQSNSELTSDPDDYGRGKRSGKRKIRDLFSDEDFIEDYGSSEDEASLSKKIKESLPPPPTPPVLVVGTGSSEKSKNTPRTPSEIASPLRVSEIFNSLNQPAPDTNVPKKSNVLKSVLRELNIIRHNQTTMLEMMSILMQRDGNKNDSHKEQIKKINQEFPMSSVEEVYNLEESMSEDWCKNELLSRFKTFGGNNFADHTRRLLRYVLSDELAEKYSWLGSREKKRFSILNLSETIIDAVVQENNVSKAQVEDVIKTWLRHAKERRLYQSKKMTE